MVWRVSQSSPAATGGAGFSFEQRVTAFLLALLLTRSSPPFAARTQVQRVSLQVEHLGWATDDQLIEATRQDGTQVRALVQAKRTFVLGAADADCQKVFGDAWRDFSNDGFDHAKDTLLLITGAIAKTSKVALRMLLDCAAASSDAPDFTRRTSAAGYFNEAARSASGLVRSLLDAAKSEPVTDDQFWTFLRCFQCAEADLETPGGMMETLTKGLLGAHDGDANAAEDDWNELLAIAASGSPRAAVFTLDRLSPRLLQRHRTPSVGPFTPLYDYSTAVARRARRQVGAGLPLARAQLQSEVLLKLETKRIVLLTGEAGSGKSGIARSVFEVVATREPAIAFAAETFAQTHLVSVLAPLGVRQRDFERGPPGSGRIIVWIESLERLLEKNERHAFDDLATLVAANDRFRLLVTCREYYAEIAHAAFFERLGIPVATVRVSLFDDGELAAVAAQSPHLAVPLASPRLRSLLRNPFILDMAARLNWTGAAPNSEREFRDKVWSELVRKDSLQGDGMPAARETAFVELALRRARGLDPWVDGHDLDQEVCRRLTDDTLLLRRPGAPEFMAPAHDLLEDWALLHWMRQTYRRRSATPTEFVGALGVAPAVRRIFRRWLQEQIDLEPGEADQFAFRLINDPAVSRQWRDDTLTAVLLAADAAEILRRNSAALIADRHALLRRAVHLLRVAGKTSPSFVRDIAEMPGIFLRPIGSAWGALMILIEQEIEDFGRNDVEFLTAFLEDLVKLGNGTDRYPPGAESAARVAWRLLPADGDLYRPNSLAERLGKIVVALPRPVAAELTQRVKSQLSTERFDRWHPTLALLCLRFGDGLAVAQDVPDLVVACAERWLGLDGLEPPDRDNRYGRPPESEGLFGLPLRLHFDTFPPSALRGPFTGLLQAHPRIGVEFVLRLANHAFAAYASPQNRFRRGPPPGIVTLDLGPKGKIEQFGEQEFWLMFRGHAHAPHVLESALMALENWLLHKVEQNALDLPNILEELLQRSNNVAITAVVASAVCAAPQMAGPSALAILSVSVFYEWDQARAVVDSAAIGERIAAMMGASDVETMIFDAERKHSSERPHRKLALEGLAILLQDGPHRAQVEAIIDRFKAELPPLESQGDEHRVIRLRLGRMDRRGWRIEPDPNGAPQIAGPIPAPDIQQLIERVQPRLAREGALQSALIWGMKAFQDGRAAPEGTAWREYLAQAQALLAESEHEELTEHDHHRTAALNIAAVCVRDYWPDLTSAERAWCVSTAAAAVVQPENEKAVIDLDDSPFSPAAPAAWLLGYLLGIELSEEMRPTVLDAFANAFTHRVQRVRLHAAGGLGWEADRGHAYADRCLHGLKAEAAAAVALHAAEAKKPYDEERRSYDEVNAEARAQARAALLAPAATHPSDLDPIGLAERDVRNMLALALRLMHGRRDEVTSSFYVTLARQLAAIWSSDRRGTANRDLEMEHIVQTRLVEYSLEGPGSEAEAILLPLIEQTTNFPKDVADLLRDLTTAEDRRHSPANFWSAWQNIADRFFAGDLAEQIELGRGAASLLNRLFLAAEWKRGVTDWKPLHGQHARIDHLFRALPASPTTLAAYARYLNTVGGGALPGAFVLVTEKVAALAADDELTSDTMLQLEVTLGNHVHGNPGGIKGDRALRVAVETLLDHLIERGSAPAFRMRDDFVTHIA